MFFFSDAAAVVACCACTAEHPGLDIFADHVAKGSTFSPFGLKGKQAAQTNGCALASPISPNTAWMKM